MADNAPEAGPDRPAFTVEVNPLLGRGTTLPRVIAWALIDLGSYWVRPTVPWVIGFKTAADRDAAMREVRGTFGEQAVRPIDP